MKAENEIHEPRQYIAGTNIELVTRDTLKVSSFEVKQEMNAEIKYLRDEIKSELKEFRAEFKEFRNEMRNEFKELRNEFKEFRAETQNEFKSIWEKLNNLNGKVNVILYFGIPIISTCIGFMYMKILDIIAALPK